MHNHIYEFGCRFSLNTYFFKCTYSVIYLFLFILFCTFCTPLYASVRLCTPSLVIYSQNSIYSLYVYILCLFSFLLFSLYFFLMGFFFGLLAVVYVYAPAIMKIFGCTFFSRPFLMKFLYEKFFFSVYLSIST